MKKLLLILLSLTMLLIIVAGVVLLNFDANRYKVELIDLVRQQTGRELRIDGELRLKPSLIPTVTVDDVHLGNAPWAKDRDMLSVRHFEATAELLPLLSGELRLQRLRLESPRIHLQRNAKGQGNWLMGGRAGGSSGGMPVLTIHQVAISDARITYLPATGKPWSYVLKRLTLGADVAGQGLDLGLEAILNDIPVTIGGKLCPLQNLVADQTCPLDLQGRIPGLKVALQGKVKQPQGLHGIALNLTLKADSLASLARSGGASSMPEVPLSITTRVRDDGQAYVLDELNVRLGHSDLRGQARIDMSGKRPRMQARLKSSLIDLAELLPASDTSQAPQRLFSTEALPVAALRELDASVDLNVARLRTSALELEQLATALRLKAGRLKIEPLKAVLAGGKLDGRIRLDGAASKPVLDADVHIQGLQPARLPQLAGRKDIRGGATDIDLRLHGRGVSMAAIMGVANGHLKLRMGPGVLANEALRLASSDLLMQGLKTLNPLSAKDPNTHLECAVVNFAIKDGVAANEHGIAMQTDKLNVLGGGRIDLKTEVIDIGARPEPREGIGINLSGMTDFVRLGGTLADPHPVTDAGGALQAVGKAGAAIATGGVSLLAEGLYKRVTVDDDVCAVALGQKPATGSKSAGKDKSVLEKTTDTASKTVKDAAQAVKGVFKGLFGDH